MRIALLLLVSILSLHAQVPTEFEVSVVRPNTSGSESSRIGLSPDGSVQATNVTLLRMITGAYDVTEQQVVDVPAWLTQERWDLQAKADGLPSNPRPDQILPLVRKLLEDRFQLRVRREMRAMPVFRLLVDGRSHKMTPSTEAGVDSTSTRSGSTGITMESKRVPMERLANSLSRYAGRTVVDRTQLSGPFDFRLEWVPDTAAATRDGVALFTALREQLGLRLEAAREQVEVLSIEHVERPDEN